MTWKAVYKHVMGGPLLCMIHCCTRHTRLKGRDWRWAPSSLVGNETQHLPMYHNLLGGTAAKFTQSKEIYCIFLLRRQSIKSEVVLPHDKNTKEALKITDSQKSNLEVKAVLRNIREASDESIHLHIQTSPQNYCKHPNNQYNYQIALSFRGTQ